MTAAWPARSQSLPTGNSGVTVVKSERPDDARPLVRSRLRTRLPPSPCSLNALLPARRRWADHAFLLQAIDDLIEALLLDLRREIGAEALDVGDSLDHDVPGLPALIGLVQD